MLRVKKPVSKYEHYSYEFIDVVCTLLSRQFNDYSHIVKSRAYDFIDRYLTKYLELCKEMKVSHFEMYTTTDVENLNQSLHTSEKLNHISSIVSFNLSSLLQKYITKYDYKGLRPIGQLHDMTTRPKDFGISDGFPNKVMICGYTKFEEPVCTLLLAVMKNGGNVMYNIVTYQAQNYTHVE